ncbi:MAG: hypothetical protein EXQ55_06640 [Acidobacteria bacterium]|nr:hypothetical protein [Acidobacteriota bacterium]
MEKFAIPALARFVDAGQAEEGTTRKCSGFFHKPAVAAHIDHIAGGECVLGHARLQATAVPDFAGLKASTTG